MEPQSFGSNDIQVLNERDLDPQLASKLWDFPCPAYHDISRSASFVATSCTVSCEGDDALANEEVDFASPDACPVAMTACRAMIECTTVLIQANGASAALKGGGSSLQGMKHLDEDDSMRRLLVNTWWGTPQLPSHGQPRPRSYIVASFGGCGSKMLAGWLAMLPRQHTRTVFHLHDRHPPQALRGMRAPVVHRRPPPGGRKTPASRFFNDPNADMRTKNFGDDATFRVSVYCAIDTLKIRQLQKKTPFALNYFMIARRFNFEDILNRSLSIVAFFSSLPFVHLCMWDDNNCV